MSETNAEKAFRLIQDLDRFDQRCAQRLKDELGVNPAGVEVILRLRSQVMDLQAQVRTLETELAARHAVRAARLSRFQAIYYEAIWYELDRIDEAE